MLYHATNCNAKQSHNNGTNIKEYHRVARKRRIETKQICNDIQIIYKQN